MSNFGKMVIPKEADGIVDDWKAFKKQQDENAKLLKKEISSLDDLEVGDYEDINGSLVKKHSYSEAALNKIQARKIGRRAILFAR